MRNFAQLGPRLKVVSIYQDRDEADGASEYRLSVMPPLPAREIETILGTYDVEPASTAGWARLCEGSPRVAHVIGQNLRKHPEDPLRSDGVTRIWGRFLAADIAQESEEYRIRHLVVSSLALFKKFGWSPEVRAGAFEVYDRIVSRLNPGISRDKFVSIIEQMAARKVLQGDNFLYITPRAFHVRLWSEWWNRHGASIDMIDLIPTLTPQMRQWFVEMIEYAASAPVSMQLVDKLLGPNGLYKDAEWLNTKEGGRFFFSLSLASPPNALRLLERTIGQMDRDSLLKFEDGRRDVIWALEGLALHSDLFTSSAKLLLALAEAENETWTNNATGVFAGLFSLGYGEIAPTSLAPEHRLPILTAALKDKDRRGHIALGAFETALAMQHMSRMGSDQPFRLRKQVSRWTPKTYGEWFAAYRLYWQALRGSLESLPVSQRKRGIEILLSRTRELLQVEDLRGEILDTLRELSESPDTDEREIISTIELILRYDNEGMPNEVASQLTALRDQLIGTSFHSRMRRYAGMDLVEDQIDRAGNEIDRTAVDIRTLAEEALAAPDILVPELRCLVTREAKNGYRFGYALAQMDVERSTWEKIRDAYVSAGDEADGYFVGGYLRAVFEREPAAWEEIIASIAAEGRNLPALLGLVWRSGMTDRIAELILQLVRSGTLPPEALGVFRMGRGTDTLSDAMLGEWLDVLIGVGSLAAASTALDLASMAVHGGRLLTAPQIEQILTLPTLRAHKESRKYLDQLVSRNPTLTWQIVSDYVKPPMNVRGFVVTRWLRGDMGFSGRSPGPMRYIPREDIWSWIEADPERRASYVANMAPKDFTVADWSDSLIRGILCRFGDSEKVRGSVFANFFTGGFSGPASSHYETQRQILIALRSEETNPFALRWLNTAIEFN